MKKENILEAVKYYVTSSCSKKEAIEKAKCPEKIGLLYAESVVSGLEHVYFSMKESLDFSFDEKAWRGMIKKSNKSKCLPYFKI